MLIVGNSGFGIETTTNYDQILLEIASQMKDKVVFTGFIHNKQLPMIHSIADIAVVPSIYDEPAGLVVIEALASGLPLIITDSGGMPEYINNECDTSIVFLHGWGLSGDSFDKIISCIRNAYICF